MPYNKKFFEERRKTLKLMMLGSGALAMPTLFSGCGGGGGGGAGKPPEPPVQDTFFPQSVASGDPREESIVLWTRIEEPDNNGQDLTVGLEVSLDENFTTLLLERTLTAYSEFDNAVKVKIDQLTPYTYYYYRFKYKDKYSNTGRTKTAPSSQSDVNAKFAFVSCQDYIGRYYNVFTHMLLQDDLDFIIHLGDYIYETNGAPMTQIVGDQRQITFKDSDGAIDFGGYQAARSIDNYRQLYQTYRSDSELQKIHERFPMIAIWDDHEFSDDNYGNNANYYGEKIDEEDETRYHNSQRVYLEYMPLETGLDEDGVLSPLSEVLLDADNEVIIYRDFNFGSHLDLIMSDYRSNRPDHLIKEDAFPATVFANRATLIGEFGQEFFDNPDNQWHFGAYFDVDTFNGGYFTDPLKNIAQIMYEAEGLSESEAQARANAAIQGNLNAYFSNEMIKAYNAQVPAFLEYDLIYEDDLELDNFEKGLAYINGGKLDLFSSSGIGSRYMVIKEVFDIFIELKNRTGAIGSVYGAEQSSWVTDRINNSGASWRVFASSVSLAPMVVDLSGISELDPLLQTQFYINVDQFDGFKYQRDSLINELKASASIVISGDIHSTFVTDHHGVVEFTGGSVSSTTFSEALPRFVEYSDVSEYIPDIEELLENVDLDQLLLDSNSAENDQNVNFPIMKTADTKNNAYVVIEVTADHLYGNIHMLPAEYSQQMLYEAADINSYFSTTTYTVDRSDMSVV